MLVAAVAVFTQLLVPQELVARVVGFAGSVTRDASKPDGTPKKLMDSSRLHALGWTPKIGLEEGVADAYKHFLLSIGG